MCHMIGARAHRRARALLLPIRVALVSPEVYVRSGCVARHACCSAGRLEGERAGGRERPVRQGMHAYCSAVRQLQVALACAS
eukprot:254727-Pleurochrysis_carterae.AAC.2